ncbi:MAG: glycosyltransferase family 39 protein [Chloroflexi bacterium]|nr:glycosyltransferase family 39 protein [Chloroflexota bacterium]
MLIFLALLILGFGLRVAPLTQNRFHPDEALYATFARLIVSGRDPLLSTVVVDKPPLPFYLTAASMALVGPTEFGARLPFLLAGVLSIALLYQLGRALYGRLAGSLAALVLALSPMAILFAITLFTDTLLVTFLLWSMLMATRQKWTWAGLAFGLAFACKQTALFFLPLIIVIGLTQLLANRPTALRLPRFLAQFALPIIFCAAIIFLWDYIRHAPISFWTQGYADNNPGRLVRSNEIWPRLAGWLDLLQHLSGTRLADLTLILGLPLLLLTRRRSLAAVYDFTLTAFTLTFLAGYWLLAFNVWDRYLLALTPVIALLLGRVLDRLAYFVFRGLPTLTGNGMQIHADERRFFFFIRENQRSPASKMSFHSQAGRPVFRIPLRNTKYAIHLILLLSSFILLPSALVAARSGFSIGGDHGAYDGIDEIADTLRQVPPGSVLYDHWLSWELGFYLFDGPTYMVWMPGPESLADDLRAFGATSPRYIVSPSWESFAKTKAAIEAAGFTVEPIQTTHRRDGSLSFTLYQLKPTTTNHRPLFTIP